MRKTYALLAILLLSPEQPVFHLENQAEAQKKIPKQLREFLARSVDDVAKDIVVKDGPLDVTATIHSCDVFKQKRGLLRIVWDDNCIRAFIDKKTGRTSYQIYQSIRYTGNWRFYRTVNYSTPTGPVAEKLTLISSDVLSCSGLSGCEKIEVFGFNVPEELLLSAASAWKDGPETAWRFKYLSKSGSEWPDGIAGLEIAAFLKTVKQYKQRKGLLNEDQSEDIKD